LYLGILIAGLTLAPSTVIRADTHIPTDSGFFVGGSWSTTGGTLSLVLYNGMNGGYFVHWSGNGWSSDLDWSGSGYCCGSGTHSAQVNGTSSSAEVYFTNDGNLLLLDGYTAWETSTGGNNGGYLDLQDDGNLVVRSSSNSALWSLF
jgi:hypothetical protein